MAWPGLWILGVGIDAGVVLLVWRTAALNKEVLCRFLYLLESA